MEAFSSTENEEERLPPLPGLASTTGQHFTVCRASRRGKVSSELQPHSGGTEGGKGKEATAGGQRQTGDRVQASSPPCLLAAFKVHTHPESPQSILELYSQVSGGALRLRTPWSSCCCVPRSYRRRGKVPGNSTWDEESDLKALPPPTRGALLHSPQPEARCWFLVDIPRRVQVPSTTNNIKSQCSDGLLV